MPAIDLDALLSAAGASLSDAQSKLLEGVPLAPTRMAMSEATLDMMVTVEGAKGSALQVAAVNSVLARAGTVTPEALSRVTMRFVAMAGTVDAAGAAQPPATGGPSTRPEEPRPPVTGPRKPLTRADMQAEMLNLSDIAPLVQTGVDVQLDFTAIGADRTMVRALSNKGDVLAVRLLDGTL